MEHAFIALGSHGLAIWPRAQYHAWAHYAYEIADKSGFVISESFKDKTIEVMTPDRRWRISFDAQTQAVSLVERWERRERRWSRWIDFSVPPRSCARIFCKEANSTLVWYDVENFLFSGRRPVAVLSLVSGRFRTISPAWDDLPEAHRQLIEDYRDHALAQIAEPDSVACAA